MTITPPGQLLTTVVVALTVAVLAVSCSTNQVRPRGGPAAAPTGSTACAGRLEGPDTVAYDRIDGVDPDLLSMDVHRRPGATGCPAIIWVHGGGWRTGDKRGAAIDTKVEWAGRLGAVLVSVNYRLATPDNDVRWPDFGRDVAAAVDRVLTDAPALGIDPSKVVLVGHSAGAQLVSIVGTNPALLGATGRDRTAVRCVVSLDSAAYDLTDGLADDEDGIYATAFGQDPVTLADASPTVQVRTKPGDVPAFLLVTRGLPRRQVVAEEFAATVQAGGGRAEVLDANPYSHAEVNRQLGVPGERLVTPPTERFLAGCLR